MQIKVCGMDPSMTNWGLAYALLDVETGQVLDLEFILVEPNKIIHKQVRQNSVDLNVAEQLSKIIMNAADISRFIFVEVPVGSQSARSMCSYGMCVGILGALKNNSDHLIEVTATEVKLALTGNKNATKAEMINAALKLYPSADFPRLKGRVLAKSEHLADALGAILAGIKTPMFQSILKAYQTKE